MNDKFRIRFCSDLDYEEMVADICYEDYFVAIITQEKGVEKMEIEILPPPDGFSSWIFPLNDLIETINIAKKRLIEMQKLEEN